MSDGPQIEFSIRVVDDKSVLFDSKLTAPLSASREQMQKAAEAWHAMMQNGLTVSQALREPDKEENPDD